jgi:LCP family protein required for cell wall assembly
LGLDKDGTRCDVIMLFNFEPGLSKLNLLSIARDTRVRKNGRYYKINALYSKGGEELVAEEVTELTGLPVHYYITVDFKGFRKIIDNLGGVEFYVPFRMNYDDPTQDLYIHLKKGMQLLDGDKAEQLVRYRKGNNTGQGYSEGDIGRMKMQQDFLKALIKQKMNLRYISRADDIFEILKKYVKTNITLTDIAQNLGSISKIKSDEIETFTMPGESRFIGDAWYFIYNGEDTLEVIEKNFYR